MDNCRPVKIVCVTYMLFLLRHYRDKGRTLVDSVMATPLFNCSDPRDHLYSLLSLSRVATGIKPDYTVTKEEVCLQFATTCLVYDQNLKVPCLAPHTSFQVEGQAPPERPDLPSWLPNLTGQGIVKPVATFTARPQAFHVGGSEKPKAVVISGDGRVLRPRGRFVDKLAGMAGSLISVPLPDDTEIHPKRGLPAKSKKRLINWMRECREVTAEGDWGALSLDAGFQCPFAEMLVCGMTGMRDPVPEGVITATQVY